MISIKVTVLEILASKVTNKQRNKTMKIPLLVEESASLGETKQEIVGREKSERGESIFFLKICK